MWKQIVDYFFKVFSVTREVDELSKDSEAHEKDIKALQAKNEQLTLLAQNLLLRFEHDRVVSEQAHKLLKSEIALMISEAKRSLPPGEDRSAASEKENEALKEQIAELKKRLDEIEK